MKKFLRETQAVTAIEFAIIAPIFFLLLIGIVEIGLTMFMDSSLNTGLRAWGRKYVSQPYGTITYDDFSCFMKNYTAGIYDPSRAAVSSHIYNNFNDLQRDVDRFRANGPEVFFMGTGPDPNSPGNVGAGNTAGVSDGQATGDDSGENASDNSGKLVLYYMRYRWGGITQLLEPYIPAHIYVFALVRNESNGISTAESSPCN